jgi:hypothetical protein
MFRRHFVSQRAHKKGKKMADYITSESISRCRMAAMLFL